MSTDFYRLVYQLDNGSYYHSRAPVRPREARQIIRALARAGVSAWVELGNFAGTVLS